MPGLRKSCLLFSRIIPSIRLFATAIPKSRVVKSFLARSLLAIYASHLLMFQLCLVLPYLLSSGKHLIYCILMLIYGCFCWSVTKCISRDPSIRGLLLSSKSKLDWTYCLTCQTLRPPRAHHCFDCSVCILRRDHHCTILGQCIGHANWRYFCNTLLYGMLGCAFMSYYNLMLIFYSDYLPIHWSFSYRLLCIIAPPGIMWLAGYLTFLQSVIFLTTSLSTLTACLLFVFMIYELNLMLTNQTMFERTFKSFDQFHYNSTSCSGNNDFINNVKNYPGVEKTSNITRNTSLHYEKHQQSINNSSSIYDVGYLNNVKQYLGERWILAILCPFINSQLTTDGLSFPTSDSIKFK
ncbi:putative palmitoyltransferase ZDHHC24 [Schistosoma japonicum]|nr:putative palmitoyltransferase ZDHHC24 [Schistosoma japonicum]